MYTTKCFLAVSERVPPVGPIQHTDVRRDSLTLEWEPPKGLDRLKSYIIERYEDEEVEEQIVPSWRRLANIPPTVHRYVNGHTR